MDTGREQAKRVVRNGKKDTTTSPLCWTAGANTIRVGGFKPVDPKDPHVVEIARFAVDEHNKQAHTNLVFLEVFGAESQIVRGRNFKLTIVVANGTRRGFRTTHEALVYEGLKGQRTLKYFKGVGNKLGGFKLVDPRDPHIVEIGRYAVDQYNKQAHKSLVFKSVIQAQVQIVNGRNYKVTIRVADGGTYEALVYEALNGQKTLNGPLKVIH
ncbi:hypothetical protein Scep_028912 [Stephania cephalantha]|uniref:Cystatin domain-containing protein n=1 Tax=Stephania cephalantha TaxID=152367 RepID=A0AAP0EAU2_9MAGN